MDVDNLTSILKTLCKNFIDDGTVHEEVIEMLVDAGADIPVLKGIGFTDDEIADYAYYEGMMTNRTEQEVLDDLLVL